MLSMKVLILQGKLYFGHFVTHIRRVLYKEPITTLFFLLVQQHPPVDQGLLFHEVSRSHTMTQHTQ